MELWDIYNEDRIKTGRTMTRGAQMRAGEYHLIVHIAIINAKGEMLIQQRQKSKHGWPGKWDISAGGCAISGESSRQAAGRELFEELGIKLDFWDLRAAFTINFDGGFDDIYIIKGDYALNQLRLQASEVMDAKWVNVEVVKDLIDRDEFVPYPKSYIQLLFDTVTRPVYL